MALDIVLSVGAVSRQSERVNQIPADNVVRQFFDEYFPDSYLDFIFPSGCRREPELPQPPTPNS